MFGCMVGDWCYRKRIWHCRGCGLGQWGIWWGVVVVQSEFVRVVCPVLGTWVKVSDGAPVVGYGPGMFCFMGGMFPAGR